MDKQLVRTEILLGSEAMLVLKNSHVIVFGIGGVGSFVVEALVRSGLGEITLVDNDSIDMSNLNRQLQTNLDNVGDSKVLAMAKRIRDINKEIKINTIGEFYSEENRSLFFKKDSTYNYIVDAIDSVKSKVDLVCYGDQLGIPVISAMGAGNKLSATSFKVLDLYQTTVDPLARILRREGRKRGLKALKVVCSDELPKEQLRPPGSIIFAPGVVGLIIAGEVIKDLIKKVGEGKDG